MWKITFAISILLCALNTKADNIISIATPAGPVSGLISNSTIPSNSTTA